MTRPRSSGHSESVFLPVSTSASGPARPPSSGPARSFWFAAPAAAFPRSAWPDRPAVAATRRLTTISPSSFWAAAKDRGEQAVVVRRIVKSLSKLSVWVEAADEPEIIKVANIQHLGTPVYAQLAQPRTAIELAGLLHPTPAVGGEPWKKARRVAAEVERMDRGWYAGPVGWMDGSGDGEFCVALRSALIRDREAHLFAGVGVVADSDPAAELAETEIKLGALLPCSAKPPSRREPALRHIPAQTGHSPRIQPVTGTSITETDSASAVKAPRARQTGSEVEGQAVEPRRILDAQAGRRPHQLLELAPVIACFCGRRSKIPPPSLFRTTIRTGTSRPRARARGCRRHGRSRDHR